MSVDDARGVIARARAAGVFPAAAFEIGDSDRVIAGDALGTLTFAAGAPPARADTPFDLASLTKAIATTMVVMALVRDGALRIDEPVSVMVDEWRGAGREAVTVGDLLEHASGLPARLLDAPPDGRREFEHDICATPLEYLPRTRSVYSDLGFILLGFIAADRGGAPLDELFARIAVRLPPSPRRGVGETSAPGALAFHLPAERRRLAAPTRPMDQDARRGRVFAGEVHDNYAAALGGVAGHAGVFGTAGAVAALARTWLRSVRGDAGLPPPFDPALARVFTMKTTVPGSSRALGWDTMLPTSSCGTRMSPTAFGHVGYTGTSLWIDPERDRYFVLLTNRVFGGGTLDEMRAVRRAFHDALGDI